MGYLRRYKKKVNNHSQKIHRGTCSPVPTLTAEAAAATTAAATTAAAATTEGARGCRRPREGAAAERVASAASARVDARPELL